ncbi:MAG: NUDIX hydrolase, partial [Thermoplasmata archaeon]|nr:NUDIX hydrolase [Candidatus Sysuiplasma superficiale]
MATARKFCAFSADGRGGLGMDTIPPDGFCLSAFLIIRSEGRPNNVLMGHLNPDGPWDHVGALDPSRLEAHRHGWMLPSSHLIYGESPDEGARRIAFEQLGLKNIGLEGPEVHSEVYEPRRFPGRKNHWDLEFLYYGFLDERAFHAPEDIWLDVEFVDPSAVPTAQIARSHED